MKKCGFLMILSALVNNLYSSDLASFGTKGILFKDEIVVKSFNDPDIKGITCYTTLYKRSLSLTDSANSYISCTKTGVVDMNSLSTKENIFSQEKGFIFNKTTTVNRIYDGSNKTLIYLSFTKALVSDKNSTHSISVVTLKP